MSEKYSVRGEACPVVGSSEQNRFQALCLALQKSFAVAVNQQPYGVFGHCEGIGVA